jgi:predicted dinucleotide-binding enzyme
MKIGVLGSGAVGQTLASGFLKHGHEVTVGTRDRTKLDDWAMQNLRGKISGFADAARFGEVLVLAVQGKVAAEVLHLAGADALAGKLVIDATNPIAQAPPVNGVLRFFTDINESLMERLQREFPGVRLVKAFNSVGADRMVDPTYAAGKPTMFICGNDDDAKRAVRAILDEFGWDTADMGKVEAARAIEPLCMLWCIPNFLRNERTHAFALLKS